MSYLLLRKVIKKSLAILLHPSYHLLNPFSNTCNICEKKTIFLCDDPKDPYIRRCIRCHSTPKYRAIAQAYFEKTGKHFSSIVDNNEKIYEMSSTSPIYRLLSKNPNYFSGGYFPDQPFGIEVKPGIWNQDCQSLSFDTNTFQLVISSETMEHVRKPWLGFSEIRRILKKGGIHVFTIPYNNKTTTISRIDTSGDKDIDILPKHYHRDPYCPEGALVYTDFGTDLCEQLKVNGFETQEILINSKKLDIQDDLQPMRVFISVAI